MAWVMTAGQQDKETMMLDDLKSWTAADIRRLKREAMEASERAEAAEARVAGMCDLYNHQSDMLDVAKDRAEAAEAEVARLRGELSTLYRRVDLVDGETDEPVQFVGVYVLRWGESEPTVAFVEWTDSSSQDAP